MKNTILASCVLAASLSANAELQPMSEFDLHEVTGQAGVDIALDVEIDVREIVYVDTDAADGGSVVIEDLHLGGGAGRTTLFGQPVPNNTSRIDKFTFSIDADADGTLNIGGISTCGGACPVDFLISTGEIYTRDASGQRAVNLVDGISVYGGALYYNMYVSNQQRLVGGVTQNYTNLRMITEFGIEDMDIDASSSLGMTIENAVVAGPQYLEQKKILGNNVPASKRVAQLFLDMYADADGDGVVFDFRPAALLEGANVFDIDLAKVTIGDGTIGRIAIDNLALNNIAVRIAGHD